MAENEKKRNPTEDGSTDSGTRSTKKSEITPNVEKASKSSRSRGGGGLVDSPPPPGKEM